MADLYDWELLGLDEGVQGGAGDPRGAYRLGNGVGEFDHEVAPLKLSHSPLAKSASTAVG